MMKEILKYIPDGWQANINLIGVMLAITLSGPLVGLLLVAFGVVLAPPWTFLSSLIYLPVACLGLPLGLVAIWRGWLGGWGLLGAFVFAGITGLFYLTILGPWLPTGMTDCQPLEVPPPQVRYACVSTSSDNIDYEYKFTLEGRFGWPVMRLVESE